MLVALMGGVALPASELARGAGVTPSTATEHLRHLVDAGLLAVRAQGRHRYFSLADARVAAALEDLAGLGLPAASRTAPGDAVAMARTCYSHFAGRLAVAFWRRAVTAGWVEWTEPTVRLLPRGIAALTSRGPLAAEATGRIGKTCLDWSERVPHVGGPLGVALCEGLLAQRWLRRAAGSRALRLTPRGEEGLRSLGVKW